MHTESCSLGQLATMHTYALTKLTTTRASCCHRHILLCIVQKTKSSHTLWLRIKKNYSYTCKQMELARKIGESAGPVPSELFLQTVIHNSHININLCSLQRARTAHERLPWKNELEWRHIQHHGPNQAILKWMNSEETRFAPQKNMPLVSTSTSLCPCKICSRNLLSCTFQTTL